MPYNQKKIRIPNTNRYIDINSEQGRKVKRDYYVNNRYTGRLVLRGGKTHSNMMDRQTKDRKAAKKLSKRVGKTLNKMKREMKYISGDLNQINYRAFRDGILTSKQFKKYTGHEASKFNEYIISTSSMITLQTKDVAHDRITSLRNIRYYATRPPSRRRVKREIRQYWDNMANVTFHSLNKYDVMVNDVKRVKKGDYKNINTKGGARSVFNRRNNKKFRKQKLKGTKTHYSFSKEYDEARGDNDKCVVDYLKKELSGVNGIRKLKLSQKALMDVFNMKEITDGIEIEKIINFVKACKPYVSLYIFNALGDLEYSSKAKLSQKSLVFLVNNSHLYPVLNSDHKKSVIMKSRIDLVDYDFDINYDNHRYVDVDSQEQIFNEDEPVVLIDESIDFGSVIGSAESRSDVTITNYKYSGGRIIAFECNGIVYARTFGYDDRKQLLKTEQDKTNNDIFEFRNQSYTQISSSLFNYYIGDTSKLVSDLTTEQFKLFERYNITPYLRTVSFDIAKTNTSYTFDINKSYTSVLMNNKYDYNIFNAFDDIISYDNRDVVIGEYYIKRTFELAKGSKIKLPNGFYPHNITRYCLDNGYITKSDITYMMIPSYKISSDVLKNFVTYCKDHYSEDTFKKLINFFVGMLGQRFYHSDRAINTTCQHTMLFLLNKYEHNNHDVNIDSQNIDGTPIYRVRCKTRRPKLQNSLPIHRTIIAGGIMELDKLYLKTKTNDSMILSYNVDSITVKYKNEPKAILDNATCILDDWKTNIGGYKIEDFKVRGKMLIRSSNIPYIHSINNKINYLGRDDIQTLHKNNDTYLLTGPPGSGKSHTIDSIITDDDIIVGFTNKCVLNHKNVKNARTIDSLFHNIKHDNIDAIMKVVNKYKTIYVDEYTMITHRHMTILYRLHELGKRIIFIGDVNQCLSISTDGKQYNYVECNMFKKMINNNIVSIDYVKGKCRQDDKLIKLIRYFDKHGKLPEMTKTKKYNRKARFNITKFNGHMNTSRDINNNVINNEINTNNPTVHTINGKRYFKGMKLVGNDNLKDKNIYNSEIYTIDKILKDKIVLVSSDNLYISISYKLLKRFGYAYSMTVYRYQGSTVDELYNICQLEMMSKREMYTSLSRASKYEYLNFDYINKEFVDKPIVKETTLLKGRCIKDRKIEPEDKKKEKKKRDKPAYSVTNIETVHSPLKTYDMKGKCAIRAKYEGYTKDFKYKKCGIEAAMTKVNEWTKSSLFIGNRT